ncbi:MAG: glycosyltransferase family 2 protein [Pelolinea sp.]|nr:glycosyltransferase family 2 protein [Pelolinea sp.]
MENQPLVTIITPSFNQAKFLSATYKSVISQSYPNIEYFIVDGGSTDGSVELIREWATSAKNRLNWWVSEKDNGQAEAINKGFSRSNGEIVAWLNSDDLYMKGAVEKAVNAFQTNPDVGLIFSNVFSIDADGNLINAMRYREWGLNDLMAFNIIGQPGVFMRKEALDAVGNLDPVYHYLLDHQLWLRIAVRYKIKYVDDFFAAARFHSEAKNVALAAEFGQEAFRIVDWMKSQPDLLQTFAANRRKILAGAFRFSARYQLDGGENYKSFNHYLKSFWFHPPTALKELSRFAYSFLSYLTMVKRMKENYLQKRLNQLTQDKMYEMYKDLSDFDAGHEIEG